MSMRPWLLSSLLVLACSGEEALVDPDADEDERQGVGSREGDEGPSGADDAMDDPDGPSAVTLFGDGTVESVTFTELFRAGPDFFCPGRASECPGLGVDLEFNPAREGELWAVFRQPYAGEPCNTPEKGQTTAGPEQAGCALLRSQVVTLHDATSDEPEIEVRQDGNAYHFMRLVTALAFAADDSFATVGEARTGNYLDAPPDFMGPTWWSSDPEIFAQDFNLNGSHLDMLHATPFGMGIAHQRDHVFWAFNGQSGSLDRYDFKQPHVPGGEDHSDGEYARHVPGQLQRFEGVPSHLAFASDGRTLYAADTGNRRIVAFDTESGGTPMPIQTADPQIAAPVEVQGPEVSVVVPEGVMSLPSGLCVYNDELIVTDAQTSRIHVFDTSGEELLVLDTELPEGTLAGITVGPDDKVYFVDWPLGRVLRIDAR